MFVKKIMDAFYFSYLRLILPVIKKKIKLIWKYVHNIDLNRSLKVFEDPLIIFF